jgi:hypothetical protein
MAFSGGHENNLSSRLEKFKGNKRARGDARRWDGEKGKLQIGKGKVKNANCKGGEGSDQGK